MKYLDNIEWSLAWSISKDTIIPHSGTLIFNMILFLIIGLFLAIIFSVVLGKTGVLKRKPKYYNWSVKLYIPIFIVVFLYVFGQIGFLRGVYKILNTENESIVTSIYTNTLSLAFESEANKNAFIKQIQTSLKDVNKGADDLMEPLKDAMLEYNSGIGLIDSGKAKISNYLIEKYGNGIYKISIYAMLSLVDTAAHTDINESLSYNEFSAATDFLLNVGYKDIELAIKEKLIIWFSTFLDSQYYAIIKSLSILLLIIMSIPFIEFFIYKKWIEPDLIEKD